MSTLEISIVIYETILNDTIARYRARPGCRQPWPPCARRELMAGAFVCEDVVLQDELQRDHHDENGIHG